MSIVNYILSEVGSSNRAVLYHFTYLSNLKKIIQTDQIKAQDPSVYGYDAPYISFTRNSMMDTDAHKVRLSFDTEKLKTKYKLEPFYYRTKHDSPTKRIPRIEREREERIQTDSINNLHRYLLAIDIYVPDSLRNLHSDEEPNNWKTIVINDFNSFIDEVKTKHPKYKNVEFSVVTDGWKTLKK